MRAIMWVIVAVLLVLAFAGDKVRSYFKADGADITRESAPAAVAPDNSLSKRGDPNPSPDRAAAGKNTGSYVPSPADAPELYDSPTKRLGF